jgi:non-lysosomal glucosylceramidase
MSEMATLMDDTSCLDKYEELANKAKKVYIDKLWNGKYLEYDSSDSEHHDSIMADMLAGQWYAISCGLPEVISHDKAISCLNIIYENNVIKFGDGKLIGAVNGMKPPEMNQIDTSCLQSREVWTGTTYALAAVMYLEAKIKDNKSKLCIGDVDINYENSDESNELSSSELKQMAYKTAQGIHDGGWQEFGYWFATPEGWEKNGNYRY